MKQKLAVGIDLGTTNSAVGIWHHEKVELVENNEGKHVTPSCAYYSPYEIFIGRMAVAKSGADPKNVLFDAKRFLAETINSENLEEFRNTWPFTIIGHPDQKEGKVHFVSAHGEERTLIPPEKVSTDILKSLLNDVCRRMEVTQDDIEAVITVPAYFNMDQKRATLQAATAAGITVKQILSEPVAAAIAYQQEIEAEKRNDMLKDGDSVFIFDLGGGTFDVTIMKIDKGIYKVIALGGDTHLGGRDFDQVVAKLIEKRLRRQFGDPQIDKLMAQPKYRYRLIKVARDVKESLSITETEVASLSDIYSEGTDEELAREEFENNARDLQEKIKKCCVDTLRDSKIEAKDINHIIRVGGASKMIFIGKILEEIFPFSKNYKYILSPDETIAKGATMYAARLLNLTEDPVIKNILIQDALPLSIGIEVAGNRFLPILKHNSIIPSCSTMTFQTSGDYQTAAIIPIYEGLSENIEEDKYIGEIELKGIPLKKAGEVSVTVTLGLDINGILKAEAMIGGTNITVEAKITYDAIFKCTNTN